MNGSPVVDVIMPVYNGAATVRSAVASIQAQSIRDLRIILVDDGSTDETPDILSEIAAADDRVLVVTKSNSGIVDGMNEGLSRGSAEFVARLDADDLAYPERFEIQMRYLEANPDCVASATYARMIDEGGQPIGRLAAPSPIGQADPAAIPAIEPYLMQPFMMARRKDLEAVGGYRQCIVSEDSDLYWRLQERGRLHNIPQVLGDYRLHAGSISSRSIANGRLMALFSQLVAISAVRRRSGRADLEFSRERNQRYLACRSLDELHGAAGDQLDAKEQDWLQLAMAMKLFDLVRFRPFELEADDCSFVRRALEERFPRLAGPLAASVQRQASDFGRYLMGRGMFGTLRAALPARFYAGAAARTGFDLLVPEALKHRIRRMRGADAI